MKLKRFARACVGGTTLLAATITFTGRASVDLSSAPPSQGEALRATFHPTERRLEIRVNWSTEGDYELRIETKGLQDLETGADVNEPGIIYLPPPRIAPKEDLATGVAENVFFFNELIDATDWELVCNFDPVASGTWKLNGRFSTLGGPLEREVVIPADRLEPGENLLHVRSEKARVPTMFFRRQIAGPARENVTLSHAGWSGRVVLLRKDGDAWVEVADEGIKTEKPAARPVMVKERWWEDREALNRSLLAVGESLLRSQVRQRGSFFEGGFHLVYDPLRESHRMSHWLWAWGPSIDLLLKLSKLEASQSGARAAQFREAALAAAERSLKFGVTDSQHPAFGVSTVRWEPSRATPLGWAEYISTADSLFLAGWGWMSAYDETRKSEYLERTKRLVAAAERLMAQYPVVPQDWIVERADWTPHTLDESVFGMIGFRRLFEATEAPEVARAGKRFLDSHLERMGRESGILARAWLREEDKEIWDPDIKGHAWVIEGYLDAHQLSGDTRYLRLADELAQKVIDCQADHGGWTYLFKKPAADDPIDDKGTAIWAYLFYDLYKSTKNPDHLAAARRALGWCLRHQYRGDDPNLDGAIVNENSMAYVRRRPMSILYSTTFFGHALLEELALKAKE